MSSNTLHRKATQPTRQPGKNPQPIKPVAKNPPTPKNPAAPKNLLAPQPTPKTDAELRLKDAYDCAILFEDPVRVIGGQGIGMHGKHRTTYFNSRAGDGANRPHIGVNIIIPRDPMDTAIYFGANDKPMKDQILQLKLRH